MPALARASSSLLENPPEMPTAPTDPPGSITTPPSIGAPGMKRAPEAIVPVFVASASAVVWERKLTAVHALPMAVRGVWGPARTSRSSALGTPKRSTTAAAT